MKFRHLSLTVMALALATMAFIWLSWFHGPSRVELQRAAKNFKHPSEWYDKQESVRERGLCSDDCPSVLQTWHTSINPTKDDMAKIVRDSHGSELEILGKCEPTSSETIKTFCRGSFKLAHHKAEFKIAGPYEGHGRVHFIFSLKITS